MHRCGMKQKHRMVSGHAQPRETTAAVVRPSGTAGPRLLCGLAKRARSEQPTPSCTQIGRVSHWKKTPSSLHIQFLKRPHPQRRSVSGRTSRRLRRTDARCSGGAGTSGNRGGAPRSLVDAPGPVRTPDQRDWAAGWVPGQRSGGGAALAVLAPAFVKTRCGPQKRMFRATSGGHGRTGTCVPQGTNGLFGATGSHLLSGGHAEGGA